jgi:DNA modification methylase
MLKLELEELQELDFDLELTGFELPELDEILSAGEQAGTEGQTDPDAVPEAKEEPVSRLGDVWLLGRHRLMCGDSTDAGSVALLMENGKADLVLTDPPYGIKRDKGFGGFGGFGPPIKRRQYSDDWDSETPPKEAFDLLLAQAQKAIVFGGNFFTDKLPCSGFWLVWDKHNTMPTFGDCELAWTNLPRQSVKKYDFQYNGLIGKEKERFHPTQKPVGLFEAILADFSVEGQTVLDLFGGSGSTLIACEKTGRVCRMMELSPRYVDVIVRRWQEFTGQEATLEDGGKTFAQVKEERGG